jgi:uncharacterized protein (DUF2141 family)
MRIYCGIMSYLIIFLFNSILNNTFFHSNEKTKEQDKIKYSIELIISNIRNKTGLIRIGFYSSDKGYPDKPEVSFSLTKDSLVSGVLRLFISDKEPGSYAISILDDENENGKMDYRFGIMPKEGFGFSNNPGIMRLKEPPFTETCFTYAGGEKVVTIRMVYM